METDEPDRAPDGPELPLAPERPGPEPLPDDTWDTAPTSARHAVRRHRPPRRLVLVGLTVAVTAVIVAVGLPLLLSGDTDPLADRATQVTGETARTGELATSVSATEPSPTDATAAATTQPPVAPPPVRASLVFEAEAGPPAVRLRRAEVVPLDGASGGSGARFTSRSGEIQFRSVQLPGDGRYQITVVYARAGSWSGSVQAGRSWEGVRFEPGAGCCASISVQMSLSPRTDTVTIELSRGDGPFPAIDRIIIDRV